MADDATISLTATILPDEISKTISGSMTVTPDDANDKWYYKLTAITTTSADLIAGRFIDYTAVDQDTDMTAVSTSDKVKFLFIKNTSTKLTDQTIVFSICIMEMIFLLQLSTKLKRIDCL